MVAAAQMLPAPEHPMQPSNLSNANSILNRVTSIMYCAKTVERTRAPQQKVAVGRLDLARQ
jgi:hypothetical protein